MPRGLADAKLYEREIHALADRQARRDSQVQLDPSTSLVGARATEVARRLAREVSSGHYRFVPLVPHAATLNGKPRTIYRLDPLDAVVWAVLTRVLVQHMEPKLGPHLYSYRKGRSQFSACRDLLGYLRRHVRERPDPRKRGVFVLRRDVRRYDENIPVEPDSQLWSSLRALVGDDALGFRGDLFAFIERAFRPEFQHEDGRIARLTRGVPTGIPTQTIACNCYLLPLDDALHALAGGFYARFGDDILFAHADLETAREAARRFDRSLSELNLEFNTSKSEHHYLTAAGRPHPDAPDFRPTTRLPYLGLDVGFDGARLRSDKRRAMWLSLKARIAHTDRLATGADASERADALCQALRTALDRRSPLAERYAPWLHFDLFSLEDLRQLDHHLALAVAERLSGKRGIRAFRSFPPRLLRARHGLPSLCQSYLESRQRGRRA
ncbi:MAG: reverse transcriptase domain-containing protein [Myxococcales bacterium]|nr:reverse transcriptase domain-containing protein [Myxococcales bacterium]